MRVSTNILTLLVAAFVVAACGGKQPEPVTQPTPTDDGAAARARQDSIDAENRARAAAEAEARARAEAEQAARDAAAARMSLLERLGNTIHFDFDKADLKSDDTDNLDFKAALLQANSGVRIRISGHADERGSDEYNLALGNRRAGAAKRYLVNKGVDAGRIDVVSYGEERPVDPGHNEDAWAKNRRDEIEIVAGSDDLVAPR
jgi:peptidoglycan-associated lipoprotein